MPEREPIAIVGIGCRFPGGVADPPSFWRLLRDGGDAVSEIPADRFDAGALFKEGAPAPGRIGTRWGGFLDGIDRLDAGFFGISPREAERLDPQQRLLLETSWEALEDAGHPAPELLGSRAGVFIGLWLNDYEARLFADPAVDFHMTTGSGRYAASGRISYTLGLQGPSVTVDTACSSSLVAVHLACRSLWSGECPLALAGGANVILQPHITIAYSQSGMMAADGRCKFGDARANGYVRSEGAAMIVLKPLSRALADGDRVYALIRGSAVNNDGRSGDYMATPAQRGQEQMLRLAYEDAGIAPGEVHYVEAHGTGTGAGDPVELRALGAVLAEERQPGRRCAVGSLKANFGHTEGAAGVAGLIKAALVLHHREIPGNLHLEQLNPSIAWDELPLVIPRELTPLAAAAPAYAGVSSFGIAGTNAHVVLEEAALTGQGRDESRPYESPERIGMGAIHRALPARDAHLTPLSARSPEALRALAGAWVERFAADAPALGDLAHSAAVRRAHHEQRLAVVASSRAELLERLRGFAAGEAGQGIAAGRTRENPPKVVFVFPGQGSQWVGMGRELLAEEPVFRAALEECEAAMRPFVEWSLLEQLALEEIAPGYLLDRIDVVQPTLVSLDIALARLWRSWGIEPAAVVGHSMGEVAAACVSGALSLADALRVICVRSRLLLRVSGRGAMAVVELPRAAAETALAGYAERVSVAASNSPRSTILSGEVAALEEILQRLEQEDVFCRRVRVDVASHSAQVDPLREELLAALEGIAPRPAAVPFYSTVLDRRLEGTELGAAYWERNLRQPVRFTESIERLLVEGHDIFLEVSPHPVLLPAVQQTLQHAGSDALALGSLRRDGPERATLLQVLGELYVAGCPVAWRRLSPQGRPVRLPTYPWQRERFWYEPPRRRATRMDGRSAHPLLGEAVLAATGQRLWESEISTTLLPYLADHRVRGETVLPAAAVLEMGLAAAAALGEAAVLEDFSFEEAILPGAENGAGVQLQLVSEPDSAQAATLQLFSRAAAPEETVWQRSARGRIVLVPSPAGAVPDFPMLAATAAGAIPGSQHYRALGLRGHQYGASFQGIEAFWRGQDGVAARLTLPEPLRESAGEYHLHPALLDGCLQLLLQTLGDADPEGVFIPVAVRRLRLHQRPAPAAPLQAKALRRDGPGDLHGDVVLADSEGRLILSLEGVQFRSLPADRSEAVSDWLYGIEWERRPRQPPSSATAEPGVWLLLADEGGVAAAVAARLESAGAECVLVPASLREQGTGNSEQFSLSRNGAVRGVVHLWSLDAVPAADASPEAIEAAQERGSASVLRLVQALARREVTEVPRLWLVTRGARAVGEEEAVPAVAHAPLWGMASVLANEHPELRCTCVDLDPADAGSADLAADLAAELLASDAEDRIALRRGERYVARLVRRPELGAEPSPAAAAPRRIPAPYRVVTAGAGVLENLHPRPHPRPRPGAGEVEIQVRAAGLNFMNVMSAMGMYPGYPEGVGPLGIECAGVVTAVGEGVEEHREGDPVVAFAFDSLATHTLADARLVAPMPAGIAFEKAATLPIAFLTASYALEYLARLTRGERVLIHSAAGGVGMAALQLARRAGAEIFATAGTPEKRDYLRSLGVEHVFDSRSLAFADEVLEATGGEGVDVVLNSLAGEAITRGLALLRPYGRFLELGKRDIYDASRVSLAPFRNQLSYFAIDLDRGARERPALLGGMLRQLMARVQAGDLAPLPKRVFPISRVSDAFREMAQAQHTGKIVLAIEEAAETRAPSTPLRSDATYLITGGLGGLGLLTAHWMVEEGARHLVLLGRSAPSPAGRAAVAEMQSMGAQVAVERADVTREADLSRVLERIAAGMPPLRGVVHAAGLLADATALQLNAERLAAAMAPKVRGAWNLHRLTRGQPLDLFVLFSSAAATLGTPGQANYAAGNAFVDALAQHRRARGLPALSIAWGSWSEVGLAATEANRGARLAEQGLRSLSPSQGIAALRRVVTADVAQLGVMRLDAERWSSIHPAAAAAPFLSRLRGSEERGQAPERALGGIRQALLDAGAREREELMEAHLRERVAQVLRLAPARVVLGAPLKQQGIDSLMTLELRNRLESDLGMPVSATVIWNYPTVALLARHLVEQLSPAIPPTAGVETPSEPPVSGVVVEGLGRDQIESLLDRELAAIDELLTGD